MDSSSMLEHMTTKPLRARNRTWYWMEHHYSYTRSIPWEHSTAPETKWKHTPGTHGQTHASRVHNQKLDGISLFEHPSNVLRIKENSWEWVVFHWKRTWPIPWGQRKVPKTVLSFTVATHGRSLKNKEQDQRLNCGSLLEHTVMFIPFSSKKIFISSKCLFSSQFQFFFLQGVSRLVFPFWHCTLIKNKTMKKSWVKLALKNTINNYDSKNNKSQVLFTYNPWKPQRKTYKFVFLNVV